MNRDEPPAVNCATWGVGLIFEYIDDFIDDFIELLRFKRAYFIHDDFRIGGEQFVRANVALLIQTSIREVIIQKVDREVVFDVFARNLTKDQIAVRGLGQDKGGSSFCIR
jgi:hypothetical protein